MTQSINVLVGCEESGTVREAFRKRGHNAWSCDLQPARDGSEHHIKGDVVDAIFSDYWDLIILHPPCDYLALSGNRWYGKGTAGHHKRLDAIGWTLNLYKLACYKADHVALENPKSVIFPLLRDRDADVQFIQPYHFGHEEFKATGFALHDLPRLKPHNELTPPEPGTEKYKQWERVWRMPPGENRKRDRSKTYDGVAEAMAYQWGDYVAFKREQWIEQSKFFT